MARKKRPPAPENHERWLVSYADFITLLFAFFVVMFASSQTDKGKAAQVSESVKKALQENHLATTIASILGGTADDKGKGNAMLRGPGGAQSGKQDPNPGARIVELTASKEFLEETLKKEIASGKLNVHMGSRGLVVTLREAAFFAPGDDRISPQAYPAIEKIAETVRALPNPVRLEGHTDSTPISNARFRSNWELSAARAIAMLEMLSTQFQLPRERFAVSGYADTVPVEGNDTEAGRGRNRRVDILILNQTGLAAEPSAPAAKDSALGPVKGKH